MRLFLCLSFPFLMACSSVSATEVQTQDISGVWVNQRGSSVSFVETEGQLTGTYNTQLGSPDPATAFPLSGIIAGDQIAFAVNFQDYGSLTNWTGQISEDAEGPFIRTLWHLTRDVPDAQEEDDMWGSITSGYAVFRPVKAEGDLIRGGIR